MAKKQEKNPSKKSITWGIVLAVALAIIIVVAIWFLGKMEPSSDAVTEFYEKESVSQKSQRISRVKSEVPMTLLHYDYQGTLTNTAKAGVKSLYQKGREYARNNDFENALQSFTEALEKESDLKNKSVLNIQIGNVYLSLGKYTHAQKSFATTVQETKETEDMVAKGYALGGIANSYVERPVQGNVQRERVLIKAISYYDGTLEIFFEDKYPFEYALLQSNFAIAYVELSAVNSATSSESIRKAMGCFDAALKIFRKDEHPKQFSQTAANYGILLSEINNPNACKWLKEAYELKKHLADNGEQIKTLIDKVCKDKVNE